MENLPLFAEFEKGKVYALPIEEVTAEEANEIATRAECQVLRMPKEMLSNMYVITAKKVVKKKIK